MKALSFKGDLVVEERPIPPIPEGHVLVKVERAVIGPLERGLVRGLAWVEPGRIVGMEGYGRVEEVGANSNLKKGDLISSPILVNESDVVGVDLDGFLAEYVVLPSTYLEPLPEGDPLKLALVGTGTLASWLKERIEGYKTLLVGGGLTNVLTSYLLNWEVPILPWSGELPIPAQMFPTVASACTQEWDIVVVSVLDAMAVDTATMCVREAGTIILHPLVAHFKQVFTGKKVNVEVMQRGEIKEGHQSIMSLPNYIFKSLVDESDNLSDALVSARSRTVLSVPVGELR